MAVLENCSPSRVFHYFEEICGIPHGSGNTQAISDYLVDFAKDHSLEYVQDHLGNVVIYKNGTAGYEQSPTVILQGHMDMVCEKRADLVHDFLKDGLNLSVTEDGYVTANGTTLGGDDGIAVAYGLALLESQDIPHPPLEVLITVDEEIGLLGAMDFDCSVLKGRRLINLDSEAEGRLWVSCAGGMGGYSTIPVKRVAGEGEGIRVRIFGLTGGHSGAEIDKNRANSNILMGRMLYEMKKQADFAIISLDGGTKDNAITRESEFQVLAASEDVLKIQQLAKRFQADLRKEYAGTDEGITISAELLGHMEKEVLHPVSGEKVIFFLMNMPYGIRKMSGSIPGLVETSSNPGIVALHKDEFESVSSVRSSVGSAKDALSDKLEYLTEFLGGEYEIQGAYPAWEYREDSPLRDKMVAAYKALYKEEPKVVAIHAGLECGLFYEKMEGLDCVSIGPNMKDIHTCEELLDIASVERVWKYLLKALEDLKD